MEKKVLSSAGPMARDVDSLALCMQALLCDYMFTLDPTVPPIPFNTEVCQENQALGSALCIWISYIYRKKAL